MSDDKCAMLQSAIGFEPQLCDEVVSILYICIYLTIRMYVYIVFIMYLHVIREKDSRDRPFCGTLLAELLSIRAPRELLLIDAISLRWRFPFLYLASALRLPNDLRLLIISCVTLALFFAASTRSLPLQLELLNAGIFSSRAYWLMCIYIF